MAVLLSEISFQRLNFVNLLYITPMKLIAQMALEMSRELEICIFFSFQRVYICHLDLCSGKLGFTETGFSLI